MLRRPWMLLLAGLVGVVAVTSFGFAQSGSTPVATEAVWEEAPSSGPRAWARGEYLLWWLRGSPLPTLVTGSPAGTPQTAAGVLGQPGTVILVGDDRANRDARSGGRFEFGYWFGPDRGWAIEGSFLFLDGDNQADVNGSDGTQIIARPFLDALTGLQASQLVSFPGVVAGTVTVNATASDVYGAEALVRRNIWCNQTCERTSRLDVLAGYRYFQLDEGLQIREDLVSINPASLIPVGTQITVIDTFRTRNQFHGGELGLAASWYSARWSLELLTKVALGNNRQQVEIAGSRQNTVPGGATAIAAGGLLAQVSNIGVYERNLFTVIPELRATLGYQLTERVRVLGGYTFLWWSNAVRPSDQIDLTVNPNLIPPTVLVGPSRPAFTFNGSSFWAQGLHAGLEFSF